MSLDQRAAHHRTLQLHTSARLTPSPTAENLSCIRRLARRLAARRTLHAFQTCIKIFCTSWVATERVSCFFWVRAHHRLSPLVLLQQFLVVQVGEGGGGVGPGVLKATAIRVAAAQGVCTCSQACTDHLRKAKVHKKQCVAGIKYSLATRPMTVVGVVTRLCCGLLFSITCFG